MKSRLLHILCWFTVAVVIDARTVFAQEATIAILGISPNAADAETAGALSKAIEAYVARTSGYKVVPSQNIDEVKLVFGCVNEHPSCMSKAGKQMNASKLLWGTLRTVEGQSVVTLKLMDTHSAQIERFISERFNAEALRKPDDMMERLVGGLLVQNYGTLRVICNVEDAQVMIDGFIRGRTGAVSTELILNDIPVGSRYIEIGKEGWLPWSSRIGIVKDEIADLNAALQPGLHAMTHDTATRTAKTVSPIAPVVERPSPRTGWKIAFWTSVATTMGMGVAWGIAARSASEAHDDVERLTDAKINNNPELPPNDRVIIEQNKDLDACEIAPLLSVGADIVSQCKRRDARVTLVNVLIGIFSGTVVASATLGYIAYKKEATFSSASLPSFRRVARQSAFSLQMLPEVGLNAAQLSLKATW